jgi:hypothetical protein
MSDFKICNGFGGTWYAKEVSVFYTEFLPCNKKVTVEVKEDILIEIEEITPKNYSISFINLLKNNDTFDSVATQTTSDPYLIQSGDSGINSFYFQNLDFTKLQVSFNGPNGKNINTSAVFEAIRVKI